MSDHSVYKPRPGYLADPKRCCARVRGSGYHSAQCAKGIKHTEPDADGVMRGWCGIHIPSKANARKAMREAEYQAEIARKRASSARVTRIREAERAVLNAARKLAVQGVSPPARRTASDWTALLATVRELEEAEAGAES
jgi:hypothetical protein